MEDLRTYEQNNDKNIPILDFGQLGHFLSGYFDQDIYDGVTAHDAWDDIIQPVILDLRVNYPHLAYRGSELGNTINFGLGGDESIPMQEARSFDDAFLMGFMLMKDAYAFTGREVPGDVPQDMWFKNPLIGTIGRIFDGIGDQQRKVLDEYSDLAMTLQMFIRLLVNGQPTELHEAFAVVAAAEIVDAFKQMEAARAT